MPLFDDCRDGMFVIADAPAGVATRGGARFATIADALAGAAAGDVVELEPGRYSPDSGERFPLVVPADVTLRAAADHAAIRVVIDAGRAPAVQLAGDGATLERLTVCGGGPGRTGVPPTCVLGTGDRLVVRDCHVESIMLNGGSGHRVTGNVIAGGVSLMAAEACEVRANYQHGLRWGAGIMVGGGTGHVVADNELHDDLCGIRLVGTIGAQVERNRTEAGWWGLHLLDARDTTARSNKAWRTMRAVDVEGSAARDNVIERQLAEHCDTGVVVERGAGGTRVTDSWIHDARVGLLVSEAGSVVVAGTAISEPRDHAVVTDRALDLVGNDLAGNELGGDVWIAESDG